MLRCLTSEMGEDSARWLGPDRVRELLAAELDEQLGRCTDRPFAEEFASFAGIGGPEDYFARIVDSDGHRLLCGIRFYGGDLAKPFVDILASTCEITDWERATDAAISAYRIFEPDRVRVYRSSEPLPGAGLTLQGDQVIAVGSCREMSSAVNAHAVSLRDADAAEAATFVEREYERFRGRNPALASKVFASDRDELEACRTNGRLAWWLVDGEIAGLIAVRRDRVLGIEGYLMVEEVVGEAFAKRGTAPLAQRAMAAWCAEQDPRSVLLGTIDAANTPSRNAAARAGRIEIGAWWFLVPEGAAGW